MQVPLFSHNSNARGVRLDALLRHTPIALAAAAMLALAGCAPFSDIGERAQPKAIETYQSSASLAGSNVAWPQDSW